MSEEVRINKETVRTRHMVYFSLSWPTIEGMRIAEHTRT